MRYKTALVTGASKGIGAAIAAALVEAGLTVHAVPAMLRRWQALPTGWDRASFRSPAMCGRSIRSWRGFRAKRSTCSSTMREAWPP